MKTPRSFSQNRLFAAVRFASVGTLLSAAATMAFIAVQPSSSFPWRKSDAKNAINKFSQNRAALFRNKLAMPGPEREGGPTAAAEQAYTNRAYPAAYVPLAATLNTRAAFRTAQARGNGNTGVWNLIGPSTTNFADVLTFSGAPYVSSGRITALATAPICSVSNCRVWPAADRAALRRADNSLSPHP